jgi:hypothetical protein
MREMIDAVKGRIKQVDGEIEQLRLQITGIKRAPADEQA